MNMRTAAYIMLPVLALFAAGCSNPLDKPFNRETAEADFTRIVKLDLIDSTEAATMAAFMVQKELIGTQVLEIGATYRDILDQAKTLAREKAEQAEAATARKKTVVKVPDHVTGSLQLMPAPLNLAPTGVPLRFKLLIENISGKRIKAIKGKITVSDVFGEPVHVIDYRLLDPVEPGEKVERMIIVDPKDINSSTRILDFQRSVPLTAQWESLDFRF